MASERPPDAFLSYTRFDDQNDGGAISEFCKRLANAVRAQTGEPFEIFQDVDGIGLGERWRGKLDQVLDLARFFIPIVTPSYFTSKACREELQKFLRAEAGRGRDDLVLPIYYIESYVVEEEELRAADPLAQVIHERQRQDWRNLRFEPFDSKEVRWALVRLATEIVRARRRAVPARSEQALSRADTGGEAEQDSVRHRAEELVARLRAEEAARGELARELCITLYDTKKKKDLGRRDALLDELRAMAKAWPEDAAVRKSLAMGLSGTLCDAKEEEDLGRRDALLDELRALAMTWPEDAEVREQLARVALLDELRALAKAWPEDAAVRQLLALHDEVR